MVCTKAGKTFEKVLTCSEFKWNVFGKNAKKALETGSAKKLTLESEIYFQAEEDESGLVLAGVLFGKVDCQKKTSKGATACQPSTSELVFTPKTFSGKFVGYTTPEDCGCYYQAAESALECGSTRNCLQFELTDDRLDYFCGDITFKWDSKKSGCLAR